MSHLDDVHMLSPADDIGVVLAEGGRIPRGHKIAVRAVPKGQPVFKYGHVIGMASQDIAVGDHVHGHNLAYARGSSAPTGASEIGNLPGSSRSTFLGIRRPDGRIATRNVIAIVATVNCSATVCQRIAEKAIREGFLDTFPAIDAIVPVTHASGCGLSEDGENLRRLRRTLAGYASHANVGGVLVVSLGCEVNQMTDFVPSIPQVEGLNVIGVSIQEVGGTRRAIDVGVAAVRDLADRMAKPEREPISVDQLVLGLNCGGSDGWSGITANPALGVASDMLVSLGGRSVLAETPEIYGAEDLLLNRAASEAVSDRLRSVVARWEERAAATGESLDNNPSPGNKAGGITTILEKSLGAVAKAGHAPLSAVYEYAERISTPGLGFMDTPGYDPVSVTGLIAGGANVVAFTTGRGSALGYGIVPVIKIATNSQLYEAMRDDMDLNAGDIIDEGISVAEKGKELFELICDTASGARTKSEQLGYGSQEFVPWLSGPVF